jgi:hypothetical protein
LDAIEILLAKLLMNTKLLSDPDEKVLYPLIILLSNPLIAKRDYDEVMNRKLCLIIGHFKENARVRLIQWLSQYPSDQLNHVLVSFKSFLTCYFFPGPKRDPAMIASVKMLGMVFEANKKRSMENRIPLSEFYMSDFATKLNFKAEYQLWISDSLKYPFSFFDYPFLFDPIAKTRILRLDALYQMAVEFEQACISQSIVSQVGKFVEDSEAMNNLESKIKRLANTFLVLEIRRNHLIEDTIAQLARKSFEWKKPVKIKFVESGEDGMDQGGVQKEFFQLAISQLLDPSYGLFVYDEETRLSWINKSTLDSQIYYELLGMLLGLAIYNGIILGISFPRVFYMKLLNESILFDDFLESFPSLGKGLKTLLEWTDGDVGDVFGQTFEINVSEYGRHSTIELIPGGSNVLVTNENRQGKFVKIIYSRIRSFIHESLSQHLYTKIF